MKAKLNSQRIHIKEVTRYLKLSLFLVTYCEFFHVHQELESDSIFQQHIHYPGVPNYGAGWAHILEESLDDTQE